MARRLRIRLNAVQAAGVLAALFAVIYFSKPAPFRRDPWLTVRGALALAPTYEARYRDCADERWEVNPDLRGFALSFVGRWAHRFYAENDAEAVAFARAALPGCRLYALSRRRRLYWEEGHWTPPRVHIDLSQY